MSVPETMLGCASLLGVVSIPVGCNWLSVLLSSWASSVEADVEGGPPGVLSSTVSGTDMDPDKTVGACVDLRVTHGVLVMFLEVGTLLRVPMDSTGSSGNICSFSVTSFSEGVVVFVQGKVFRADTHCVVQRVVYDLRSECWL